MMNCLHPACCRFICLESTIDHMHPVCYLNNWMALRQIHCSIILNKHTWDIKAHGMTSRETSGPRMLSLVPLHMATHMKLILAQIKTSRNIMKIHIRGTSSMKSTRTATQGLSITQVLAWFGSGSCPCLARARMRKQRSISRNVIPPFGSSWKKVPNGNSSSSSSPLKSKINMLFQSNNAMSGQRFAYLDACLDTTSALSRSNVTS